MFSRTEVFVWVLVLVVGIMLSWTIRLEANEHEERRVLTEWTTQLVYDTTNACYQGTIRWIMMLNPSLIGQNPNPLAQRQMVVHCFCVLDKIKEEVTIEEYQKNVFDEQWTGDIFLSKALECVKKEKTLPSFFAVQAEELTIAPKAKTDDNETKTVTPEESGDLKNELPSQEQEESEEDSATIFQG